LTGTLFGDLGTSTAVGLGVRPFTPLLVEMDAGLRHLPAERDYWFAEEGMVVNYHSRTFDLRTYHCAAQYDDTLAFPLSLRVWYDLCDRRLWERVTEGADSTVIAREPVASIRSTAGMSARYVVSAKWLEFGLWGAARWNLDGGAEPATLPGAAGVELVMGGRAGDPLELRVAIEHHEPVVIRYLVNDDNVRQWRAPAQTRASCRLRIPVTLPLFADHLGAWVRIDGGPVILARPFDWWRRRKQHPRGNLIGPSFSLRLDARLVTRGTSCRRPHDGGPMEGGYPVGL
jgi:hypothetical protein